MLTNFHTHHRLCRHACGVVRDYVKKAIDEGYDIIGISDHAPLSKYYDDRMKESEFEGYLEEINACKKNYHKHIKIFSGLEIEYFPEFNNYYKNLQEKLDYLILACHDYFYKGKKYCAFFIENDEMLIGYFENLIEGIQTNHFNFAAHPDLFLISYTFNEVAKEYTHKLARTCQQHDFILEFNANGYRRGKTIINGERRYPYPYEPFWNIIKQYNVKVIVNSDCHNPKYLNDEFDQMARLKAKELGLNVCETIF